MKNSKKWMTWISVLAMSGLLVACGGKEGDVTTAEMGTIEITMVEITEESTEETTPVPTEPLTLSAEEVKVGMIFYGEESENSLLAYNLYQDMVEAASDMDIGEDQIRVKYNSYEADWTQIEDSILACVDEGCQLILGCAREYEAVIAAIAEEYPQIMFACVGSELYNGVNSGTFVIDVGAAQYLQGALAGLLTDTDRVGFVAAKGKNDEKVTEAVNAFAYGVWSTNSEAVIDVAVIGKWFLPEAESYGRDYLDGLGCDQIGSYTDGSIGGLIYHWEQYYATKLNQIMEKEVVGEVWAGDYYDGSVTCELTTELPEYVWDELTKWGTVMEEIPAESEAESETQPETETLDSSSENEAEIEDTSMEETSQEEALEEITSEETTPEETEPPYEIPEINIDRDTGYLPNVRIHEIDWEE